MSSSNRCFLTCIQVSQEADQVVWYSHLFQNSVYCDPHSQGYGIVNKAETDVFLELSCFFNDPADVGNLISGSSAIWKTQQWPQDWKRSVFIPVPKKVNPKECSNYHTIALISHASKVMLKILQARLQQYMDHELPDVQAGFRKGRGTRDQIANIHWIIEKAREFQKNIYFCFLTMSKMPWLWITINCGKFWKRWEYQTTWPASWQTCMQVRKQQLELDMEWQTGSK